MRKAITAAVVRAVRAQNEDSLVWDTLTRGFVLRATVKGAATFFAIYRTGRYQRRFRIGAADRLLLADARSKAREILARAELGEDPAAEQKNRRHGETVAEALAVYFESNDHRSRKAAAPIGATLNRDILPTLGAIKLRDLTADDVRRFRDEKAKSAPVAANRALAYLKSFLVWCVEDGRISVNPAAGLKKATREKPRDRHLSKVEIAAFWRACGRTQEPRVKPPYGDLFRFLLLTGQRLREGAEMTWAEIDVAGAIWCIPAARTKTGRAAIVPLSRQALALLREIPRFNGGTGFVFTATGAAPVSNFSRARSELLTAFAGEWTAAGMDGEPTHFTLHDLRRTARTGFSEMGVVREVGELILNHSLGGNIIEATYDRYTREPEKRQALQRWADRIDAFLLPRDGNVTPLRRVGE